MFFIWMEREFYRASNGTGPTSKFHMSRQESSKQVDFQNLSGCCATIFWAVGPCIVLTPIGAHPGGHPRPNPRIFSSYRHIRVWVLFSSSFPLRNRHLHCNCDVESFCCESGPRSCSSPLWWWVLLWSELEPHTCHCFIHIHNFRLRVYNFLLVFFDSLAELAFLVRSIKLCLIDNQQSCDVTVAGFELCLIRSYDRRRRVLHQSKLSYLSEDRASAILQKLCLEKWGDLNDQKHDPPVPDYFQWGGCL
jgi:hypothetical protein